MGRDILPNGSRGKELTSIKMLVCMQIHICGTEGAQNVWLCVYDMQICTV